MSEHTPLTDLDELPIHQSAQPLRVLATSDPRAYERYWFTAHDPDQDLLLVIGFGHYPNLDTADAYAIVVHESRHTTVRAHRRLGDDRTVIGTGPIAAQVVEPFRQWRLTVADNAQDLTVDIRWYDRKRAVFHRMGIGEMATNAHGRLAPEMVGYESFGAVEGEVSIRGKRLSLNRAVASGSRDHHWGFRDGVGGIFLSPPRTRTHLGQWVEFGDWSIWDRRVLLPLGDARPGAQLLEQLDCRLGFDPETRHLRRGVITNRLADGSIKEVHYEPIGDLVAYMRCGMYFGVDSGTPEEGYCQGTYVGENVVGGESYDLRDAATRTRIGGFEDLLVRATCEGESTVGILETRNPLLYDMCASGVPGFAFLDEDA